ncbi:MAG: tRNA1(Val) (adenine(37)-N6)-methyltransferase [Bacilli bacterium]
MLLQDERLDDVIGEGLKIIQSDSVFSFSLDAVLLANFASIPIQKGKIIDLCSGNAIIPLILSKRSKAKIVGVEIQERLVSMAERSIAYNGLTERIQMVQADLKTYTAEQCTYDTVTCNPPYFQLNEGMLRNGNEHFTIARHEVMCTLDDVIFRASRLAKEGGKVAIVHRPNRFIDIVTSMRAHRIEPKRIRFVYPKQNKEANVVLVEGIRGGKPDVKMLPPLYVYDQQGEYTEEVQAMLDGNRA